MVDTAGRAQANPLATTLTTLYTVAAATQLFGASIVICNQGTAGTFRVAVRLLGAAISAPAYLAYDTPIDANGTIVLDIGATLIATDVVSVYASSGTMSFGLFGTEVT